MSCNTGKLGADELDDCKCHAAVLTAYEGMKHCGPETAIEAALRVYKFHHPEDAFEIASMHVQRWIAADHIH